MSRWRREAPAIVWALVAVPCLMAAVVAAETAPSSGIEAHVPEIFSIVGTGIACFGIAQHQADKNLAEMRRDRAKDIAAAIAEHDAAEDVHVAAGVKAHRPLEKADSAMNLRVRDLERLAEQTQDTLSRLVAGQERVNRSLTKLLHDHAALINPGACPAVDVRTEPGGRASDPPGFDPTPLRGRPKSGPFRAVVDAGETGEIE